MEYVLDLGFTIVGSIIGIMGGIMGVIWAKSSKLSPKIVNSRINQYENRIDELEHENRKLKGKMAQSKQLPTVQGDYDLSNLGSVEALIRTVLPNLKGLLPKDLQGLVDDPNIIKYALELYNQNPDKAKQLLGKFIGKGKQEQIETATL